jgi:putative toxin-antitoxin system antitoxin component (TIGR02293 family)
MPMKPSPKPVAQRILVAPKVAAAKPKRNPSGLQEGEKASSVISGGNIEFHKIYMFDAQERIDAIKRGVPAETIGQLSEKMNIPKAWLIGTLGLSRATLSRKERERKALSTDESERVLGVQALIGQVEQMVSESGDPVDFDAAKWVSGWLNSPVPALGGKKPASYMDTIEGQKLISNLLAMTQSGAYA